ncbi:MAG: hypothetical protein M0P00_11400 [Bacteroidaceae bacterium]|nr:hypothetical protein [Bacteroidaceae bacterium]
MILVVESKSTRAEWALIDGGEKVHSELTEGINPYIQTRREISRSIRLNLSEEYFKKKYEHIYYYGAGCSASEKKKIVGASLVTQFKSRVTVESDLLGVARSLFANKFGIACILGAGSNSCFYNGDTIVKNVKPCGYILGDEGSGTNLGKRFLADLLKRLAPERLISEFQDRFHLTEDEIMEAVYDHSTSNQFLNSIGEYLLERRDMDYVKKLLNYNLHSFFDRCLCQYEYSRYPISFVGSIAFAVQDELRSMAHEYGIEIKDINETSMEGLISYHMKFYRGN